jgi:hypothetical protein
LGDKAILYIGAKEKKEEIIWWNRFGVGKVWKQRGGWLLGAIHPVNPQELMACEKISW